jgi:hypothetical protein
VSNHVPSGNSSVVSLGNNISDDASGNLTQASDKPNTDAVLAPLSYNNSNLPTHAPLPGSPAIDGGADLSGDGITTDQRSVTRPQGSAFDIGAHEVQFDFGGDGVPGNVDGDADFDANDSFLIHLVKLSGTDTQIDESKGSSPVSAAEIRAAISQLHTVGDVDGDQDFDANDSFLIHLVKLSGTDAQIDQSRGSSALSATQIRANVDDLGGGRAVTQDAASPRMMQAVFAVTAERELFRAADQVLTALPVSTESPELQSAVFLDDFRKWIDAI